LDVRNGPDWKDFSSISIACEGAGLVSLYAFYDALYAKSEDDREQRRCYQLNDGPVLYRGSPLPNLPAFRLLMMDMPIGIVLSLLTHQFKQLVRLSVKNYIFVCPPCTQQYWYQRQNVAGNATRVGDTTIAYELSLPTTNEQSAAIRMSGKIELSLSASFRLTPKYPTG